MKFDYDIRTAISRMEGMKNRRPQRSLLTVLLLVIAVAQAFAIKERVFATVPGDFLKATTVRGFYKDDRGLVMLATEKGVVAFDGLHVDIIPIYDGNNVPQIVSSILQTDGGGLLLGTFGGLYVRTPESERRTNSKIHDDNIKHVNALTALSDGRIGVATDRGLAILSSDLDFDKSVGTMEILSLMTDNGRTYVGASNGAYELRGDSLHLLCPDFPEVPVNAILLSGRTLYLGAANNGLYSYNLNNNQLRQIDSRNAVVTSLAEGRNGEIFVGTDGEGLLLLDKTAGALVPDIPHRHHGTAFHNDQIYALMSDRRGQLFIGYYQMGASYSELNSKLFKPFDEKGFNTAGKSVRNIYCDDSYMFVGTRDGAYILPYPDGELVEIHKDALNSNLVISSYRDGDRFYIGTYGGGMSVFNLADRKLSKTDFRQWGHVNPSAVFCITPDAAGDIWLGSSHGIYRIVNGAVTLHIPTASDGSQLGNVYEIFTDSRDRQWVCTSTGIYLHDRASSTVAKDALPKDFITDRDVRQVYETNRNHLLFVGYDGKIYAFDRDLRPSEHAAALLQLNDVRGVVQDKNENVWITTSDGLFRYVPQSKSIISYDGAEGVECSIFNQGKPIVTPRDNIYFCNTRGLLTASVAQTPESSMSFRSAVPTGFFDGSGIRFVPFEKESATGYVVRLNRYEPQLDLLFSDFSYTGFDNDRYEYSLDNGRTWSKTGSDMRVNIHDLAEGETVLRIRQLGNPRTQNEVTIVNMASGKLPAWIVVCMLVICVLLAAALVLLYRKHRRHVVGLDKPAEQSKKKLPFGMGNRDEGVSDKKYAANYLSEKEADQLAHRMSAKLRETRIFTNPELKIADVAALLEVSSHKISYVLSQHLKTNYYDYIYAFRIEEFKRLAKADKKQRYTLTALSEKAGFNSRATFFRSFKKIHGITPGEYLKQLREGNPAQD